MRTLLHILFIFLLSFAVVNIASAEVKAFLNQDRFYAGDPITLTIEASGNGNSKPNLAPLKKDFDILGTNTSTHINILNGHKRVKKSWTIELLAKRKGAIQIPSINLGSESTLAVNLNIIDIPTDIEKETKKHVFVESSVEIAGSSNSPYVQQQIPFTVKLYYDASMLSGKIYSPSVENAIVEQLGNDRRYRTLRNGKKYSVIEKHFVISPEKSGKLHIPATTVKGRLRVSNANNNRQMDQRNNQDTDFLNRFFNNSPFSNDPFFKDLSGGFFSNRQVASKPFTASSKAIEVIVQPLPSSFTGDLWLPAEELIIEDSWSTSPPELRVGEPVTRVLLLRAKGLAGSQIPKIDIPKPSGFRTYPEQEKTETRTDGKTVYGISEMKISYIPDATGNVTIPEIKLDWWNVVTKKQQTFILPELNLTVGAGMKPDTVTPFISDSQSSISDSSQNINLTPKNINGDDVITTKNYNTLYWILSLLALFIIAGLGYLYTKRQKYKNQTPLQSRSISTVLSALQKACQNNQPHTAEKQLLNLVNASWQGANMPQSLGSLATTQVSQGRDAILELQRSLYSKNNSPWEGSSLWKAFSNGLQLSSPTITKHEGQLKPLYPTLKTKGS